MKKLLFFFALFFVAAICVYSLAFSSKSLKKEDSSEQIFLELWHVDCFEGGTGSRKAYLEKICKKFCAELNSREKTRVTVSVRQLTPLALDELFKKGVYPNILSYGAGVQIPYDRLVQLDFISGNVGVYNGEAYAAVWAQGGYALIKRAECEKIEGVIICEQERTNALLSYELSIDEKFKNVIRLPSKEGVYEFYRKKNYALIGTQRDLYRLENKLDYVAEPLEGYNDLYCCLSVIKSGKSELEQIASNNNSFTSATSSNNAVIKKSLALAKYICLSENAIPSSVGLLTEKGEVFDKSAPISPLNGYSPEYALSVFTSFEQICKMKELSANFTENEQIIKNMLKRLK